MNYGHCTPPRAIFVKYLILLGLRGFLPIKRTQKDSFVPLSREKGHMRGHFLLYNTLKGIINYLVETTLYPVFNYVKVI